MLTRFILILLLICTFYNAEAQVRISLFYGIENESSILRVTDNEHTLYINGKKHLDLIPGDILFICKTGERVAVNLLNKAGIMAESIEIRCNTNTGFIDVAVPGMADLRNEYEGDLFFSSSLDKLKIINTINMDSYIAGVVQAEGGYKGQPEYFKTQAVIVRTYASLHINKHLNEGYDLCDDVHCQAYHGRSVTALIDEAVLETRDQVLVDDDSILILTPFHSNCGGETVSSEHVWLSSKPYLVSVFDPYCGFSANATWEKDISRNDWIKYLQEKGDTGNVMNQNFTFNQNSRKYIYICGDFELPLTTIRTDWALRSTFFSITDKGDILHLSGRGYGHGVGLCQEGTRVMARRGFTYRQILNYYYKDVHLENIKNAKPERKGELSF